MGEGLLLAVIDIHGAHAMKARLEIVDERGFRGRGGGVNEAHVDDAGEVLVAIFDSLAVHGARVRMLQLVVLF